MEELACVDDALLLVTYDFLGKKIAVLQPRKPNTITFGALFILGTVMNRPMLIHVILWQQGASWLGVRIRVKKIRSSQDEATETT